MLKGKSFGTVRDCVNFLNKENIKREDIFGIIPNEGLIFALYYEESKKDGSIN